jgi:hypothetical protein
MGKLLVFAGLGLAVIGLLIMGLEKLPWFGKLPGDVNVQKPGFSFHFPIVTCIIISIILSIVLNLFTRR